MPRLSWLPLKEEMGRRQYKNSSNNLKGNMTSTGSRNHATQRIEHPTLEEVDDINFKQNIMKIKEKRGTEKNVLLNKINKNRNHIYDGFTLGCF